MTNEQIDQIFTSLENSLNGIPVHVALSALAGITGSVLSSLPSNLIEQVSEQYITMIKEVTTLSKEFAEIPTLQ